MTEQQQHEARVTRLAQAILAACASDTSEADIADAVAELNDYMEGRG